MRRRTACRRRIAFGLSQRFYPFDYEHGRLTRAIAAAAIGYVAAAQLPAMPSDRRCARARDDGHGGDGRALVDDAGFSVRTSFAA